MKKIKGFTIIEIMVVISIIGILAAIAVPSMASMVESSRIRSATESISSAISTARTEAIRRNTNIRLTLNADLTWSMGCETVVPDNDGDGLPDCPAVLRSKTVAENGDGNVGFVVTPANANVVTFNSLGLVRSDANTMQMIDIPNATSPSGFRIDVGVGTPRVCKPTITSTSDPRRCS